MADTIRMQADGTLSVPDEPIIPYVEGDGTGVDIWPAARLVMGGVVWYVVTCIQGAGPLCVSPPGD